MRNILLSLAAAATLAGAVTPAAAQSYERYERGYDQGYDRPGYGRAEAGFARGDRLEWRIAQAERSGQLNRSEARRLRQQLRMIEHLAFRFQADGVVTPGERRHLDQRFAMLRDQLRHERHDRDYGYGYGAPRR